MAKKKTDDEELTIYIVSRKKKGKTKYEDFESPVFEDYEDAATFVDIERKHNPEYLYRIDEF